MLYYFKGGILMFSIRKDLDEKRQEAVKDLCGEELEQLFIRFNNILKFKYGSIELLSKREVTIVTSQINPTDVSVSIISRTQKGELIEVYTIFSEEPKIDELKSVIKYLLERESLRYEITEGHNALKFVFEI